MKKIALFLITLIHIVKPIYGQVDASINQLGFSYDLGVNIHDFSNFNNEINKYDFIPLEDACVAGGIQILFGNPKLMWVANVSLFSNILIEYENTKYVNFYGYSMGGRLMQNILEKKAFRSRVYLGVYNSTINLSFVDGTTSSIRPQSLNQFLGANPVSHVRVAKPRTNANIGFTFEYVTDWFISKKMYRREFINMVLDVGYMHNLKNTNSWVIRGVRTPNRISGVPELNTNHFYMFLTYRFMFDTIFNPK